MCARPQPRTALTGKFASTTVSNGAHGLLPKCAGQLRLSGEARAGLKPYASPATSCSCAPATTNTRKATRRISRAARSLAASSCIRKNGRIKSTTAGKRVVVIGSGATAVTLVPEMAKQAAHVTMLQRSPTYVVSRPAQDPVANKLRRNLPAKLAYHLIRWRNVLWGMYFFQLSRRKPARVKELILGGVKMALGPDYDIATHFTPRYNPWDQLLCLVPDGDLFKAIREKRASVVTNEIETFTKDGIRLKDGSELQADIIVTATGLVLQVLGGMEVSVDGRPVDFARTLNYKGMMYSDVPNLASSFGYTNASWTLKCDLTCEYVCRLINYMDRRGYKKCMPHN